MAVHADSVLTLGTAEGAGGRAYLAVAGGFDVPEYMGSQSTFILGHLLRAGDVLHISPGHGYPVPHPFPESLRPLYGSRTNQLFNLRRADF